MITSTISNTALDVFTELFNQHFGGNGNAKDQFLPVRQEAFNRLLETGLPDQKNEKWKYTRIDWLKNKSLNIHPSIDVDIDKKQVNCYKFEGVETNLLVFVNGVFSGELSEIYEKDAIRITSARAGLPAGDTHLMPYFNAFREEANDDALYLLNTAFFREVVFVEIPANTSLKYPVYILNLVDTLAPDSMIFPRTLVVAGENAKATLIEQIRSLSPVHPSMAVSVVELVMQKNASVDWYTIQPVHHNGSILQTVYTRLERDSRFSSFNITFGGKLSRAQYNVLLSGENASANLYGLYMTNGEEHADNRVFIEHRAPHCESFQLYKGILADKSSAVFNGKIHVYPGAQKTNGFQSNKNLLLSDDAIAYSMPQLEIYADDVKCSHGATTGQINTDALFYLRSRGLNEKQAKAMLNHAFAAEVVDHIPLEPLKELLLQQLAVKLELDELT